MKKATSYQDQENQENPLHPFSQHIKTKVKRKLKARRTPKNVWFGFGLFGLVGWSIVLPTLIGIAIGIWIDTHIQSRYSWTLMLLVMGLALGCLNAWYWMNKEIH